MRIFGLEITRAPRPDAQSQVWNRSTYFENGRRINDMTPDELRRELKWIRQQIDASPTGSITLTIKPTDVYQRLRLAYF